MTQDITSVWTRVRASYLLLPRTRRMEFHLCMRDLRALFARYRTRSETGLLFGVWLMFVVTERKQRGAKRR